MKNNSPSRRAFLLQCGAGLAAYHVDGALRAAPPHETPPNKAPTVDEVIQADADAAPLAMQFRGRSAEECRRWQAGFSNKLRELLGPHAPPKHWKTTVERVVELEDHSRRELILSAKGHPSLPVYLLVPAKKTDKPRPGVLALHGHGNYGYDPVAGRDDLPGVADAIEKANYDYGRQLVRRGYIVAAPCMTPFGRRLGDRRRYGSQDPCAVTFVRMQLLGKVLMAENLRDCLWAVELLARDDRVDAKRLACVGLSYGGRMTMLTTALEPRIRAAIVSGALNVMQERIAGRYSCGAQVIPGLLQVGDVPEIGSLIAPRPCVWEGGSRDGLIKEPWAGEALTRMRRAYHALGAEKNLAVDRFEGGHRFNGALGLPMLKKVIG